MILHIKEESLGGKGLTGTIFCPSLFLNPFPPRQIKTAPFILMHAGNFTCQGKYCKYINVVQYSMILLNANVPQC